MVSSYGRFQSRISNTTTSSGIRAFALGIDPTDQERVYTFPTRKKRVSSVHYFAVQTFSPLLTHCRPTSEVAEQTASFKLRLRLSTLRFLSETRMRFRLMLSSMSASAAVTKGFLPLDEAEASRSVFVIVSWSDSGRAETLLEPAK